MSVFSLALDGVSFVATGQTTTDHVLSAMVEKDCRLLNFWVGDPICTPFAEGEKSLIAKLGDQPAPVPAVAGSGEVGGIAEDWRQQVDAYVAAQEAERLLAADLPGEGSLASARISFERLSLDYRAVEAQPVSFAFEGGPAPRDDRPVVFERRTHLVTATLPDQETARLVAGTQGATAAVVEAQVAGVSVFRVTHSDVGRYGEDPLTVDPLVQSQGVIAAVDRSADRFGASALPRSQTSIARFCSSEVCGGEHGNPVDREPEPDVRSGGIAFASFGSDR
ncbi:MAG: hypothetical protein NXI16_02565 [Alphaproteobacteria bacterium]|nr:hypothetical protein [Alphaproteobacteria bacterium]